MLLKLIVVLVVLDVAVQGFTSTPKTIRKHANVLQMTSSSDNSFSKILKAGLAAAITAGSFTGNSFAADYAPSTAPPQIAPQIIREKPKAATQGAPEKWIYSKFLDEVEKDHVEKVTFAPDGKKAVGVNDDGDRFTVDIPNDPNLLSFLVQHKVEINVAPINANGNTGSGDSPALQIPESDFDKILQTFALPGLFTSLIFLIPTLQLLLPSKEDLDKIKTLATGRTVTGASGPGRAGGPAAV